MVVLMGDGFWVGDDEFCYSDSGVVGGKGGCCGKGGFMVVGGRVGGGVEDFRRLAYNKWKLAELYRRKYRVALRLLVENGICVDEVKRQR